MNPFVFIVGCPRSGTTLLQRILDSHPQVAVTPETHWIPRWYEKKGAKGITPGGLVTRKLVRKLVAFPRFGELGINRAEVEALIEPRGRPLVLAALLLPRLEPRPGRLDRSAVHRIVLVQEILARDDDGV